ncbi:MAG: hypothetical protein IT210_14055 [Armatimonadetes bacterium]|nr:hypothetical protein [Armatimonadota bacterium]
MSETVVTLDPYGQLSLPFALQETRQAQPGDTLPDNLTERLQRLLGSDLGFHGQDSSYASHNLHAFAAKFPPQLPRFFIEHLTAPGELVLDPMMGSGTTAIETILCGRKALGCDMDALAICISRVKTTPLGTDYLLEACSRLRRRILLLAWQPERLQGEIQRRFPEDIRNFLNYWFLESTQSELMAILLAIEEEPEERVRRYMTLAFSSIIITKSGGVSLARDLAHSRPHLDREKTPKSAFEQFDKRLRKNMESICRLSALPSDPGIAQADARILPFQSDSIHLIVTSPPYANAIDYMRAHKFSLIWLGHSIRSLAEKRSRYIGSERLKEQDEIALPIETQAIIRRLGSEDQKKSLILKQYYIDMRQAINEMRRVLLPGRAAILVVGSSTMRGMDVQTHHCLAEIGDSLGFQVIGVVPRQLDRNKRMMPARFGVKSDSLIEQRMHEEYVIGFIKPI